MKIIVVGLGSMGRRRIRLLRQISSDNIVMGIDSRLERRNLAEEEFGIKTLNSLTDAIVQFEPDAAVISTSPLAHADIIEQCLNSGINVFTELNLVSDKYEQNIRLAKEGGKTLFLSSTFLYRSEVEYIKDRVLKADCKLNYSYHVGQYLPDWHPWEKISDYFVGDKKTNGCRELMAIELPWIIDTFGKVLSCKVLSSKNTNLGISYDDNYMLLIEHDGGNKGMIAIDVVSRKAVRNLEVFGENIYLNWDGTPDGLQVYDYENKKDKKIKLYDAVDKQDGYASFVIENAYKKELETFIGTINGTDGPRYTFEEDYNTLKLIDKIEGIIG